MEIEVLDSVARQPQMLLQEIACSRPILGLLEACVGVLRAAGYQLPLQCERSRSPSPTRSKTEQKG